MIGVLMVVQISAEGSAMEKRGPLDKPFLVFVVIVTICLVALAYAIYPNQ